MKLSPKYTASALLAFIALLGIVALASAAPLMQDNNPIVIINKPPSNSTYNSGDIVSVESVSASPVGIFQVDLLVDGNIVSTDEPPGQVPQIQFTLIQRWLANLPGTHVLTVRATDGENRTGEASISVTVQGVTPTITPTLVPAATATPFTCVLGARFVKDVTIPDNTVLAPGSTFVKTWTLQNNGSCGWDPATVAVFVSGSQMAGGSPSPVGAIGAGQNFNLSINFVAPTTPGTYRSSWKIQSGNGTQFGETFYVKIVVPGAPTPTPFPTPIPPPPPPIGCQGAPQISSFTADRTDIKKGESTTLRWGLVGNADSVYLESPDGSGGVPTPGQTGIQPDQTGTYTLAAYCKGYRVQAQVTITVRGGGGGGGGGANGSIDGMNVNNQGGGRWQVRVFYSWNGAGGPAQVCASADGASNYPCTNARSNAPYAVLNLQGNRIGRVTACLIDRGGGEFACGRN